MKTKTKYIWFVRRETDYGPFFSSLEKAVSYLKETSDEGAISKEDVSKMIKGCHDYENIEKVPLNNTNIRFDG